MSVFLWVFGSVLLVSLVSLVGAVFFLKKNWVEKNIFFLIAFSAGTLLGDAFIHLLPEAFEVSEEPLGLSLSVLAGFVGFFLLEKVLHWHHHHGLEKDFEHEKPFGWVNLAGDFVHNFLDGTIIAAGFLISIPIGVATTVAVVFHELPQELSDFGVLLAAGFSRKKALLLNFLSAISAVAGAFVILFFQSSFSQQTELVLVSIVSGGFIYIAGTDLLPQLQKEKKFSTSMLQLAFFCLGLIAMYLLLYLE